MGNAVRLGFDHPAVMYLCRVDKRLEKVIRMVGEIEYIPHEEDEYPFLIHEIIEQMLSVKAGQAIFMRLEDLCKGEITPERISKLTDEQIRSIGTSNSKVKCIRSLTDSILKNELDLKTLSLLPDDAVMAKLTSIHGIGKWTAKMYLMFVLNRPDILPYEDGAFLQTYRWAYKTDDCSSASVIRKCKKWQPYSSIASRFFYRALDAGLTRDEFHLFK